VGRNLIRVICHRYATFGTYAFCPLSNRPFAEYVAARQPANDLYALCPQTSMGPRSHSESYKPGLDCVQVNWSS
jgi:hypothetical protein